MREAIATLRRCKNLALVELVECRANKSSVANPAIIGPETFCLVSHTQELGAQANSTVVDVLHPNRSTVSKDTLREKLSEMYKVRLLVPLSKPVSGLRQH